MSAAHQVSSFLEIPTKKETDAALVTMEAPSDFTPARAPILCLVCTATACGSQLIATINVTLDTTLAEVRSVLVSLAAGGDGGPAAVKQPPTNVSAKQAHMIVSSPLHPFNFTETFSFVHCGGCRAYARAKEASLLIEDVLPRYPRFGVPPASLSAREGLSSSTAVLGTATAGSRRRVCTSSCTRWLPDAAPPLVVVAHPRQQKGRRSHRRHQRVSHQADEKGTSVLDVPRMPRQKRYALAALFVTPGDHAEGGLRAERVVAERLQLQLPDPLRGLGAAVSGPGLFSSATLAANYGRPFRLETWCCGVTRWNGNTEDFLGRTLLHEAAQVGNEAAVHFLASQPYVAVDAAERQSGCTALQLAVLGNHVGVVKVLLEEGGANPLISNRAGDTSLHIALERRRAVLVGLLCARLRALQVPPAALQEESMRNSISYTPVELFRLYSPSLGDLCRDGASLLAVKSLVHHYFFSPDEVTTRDAFSGQSVLHAAVAGSGLDVVRYVAEDLGLAARLSVPGGPYADLLFDYRRQTPLHVAAATGEPACVQYLLHNLPASCLTQPDVNGSTPLLAAMKARRWRVVELLLAQCPPGTLAAAVQDRSGLSALHFACSLGMTRVAAILLQHHSAVAAQRSVAARPSSSFSSASSMTADEQWGSHWENIALVRHSALRGRLRKLEEREIRRQAQRQQRSAAASGSLTSHSGRSYCPLAEDADPVAAVKAARQYPYGGARRGYTPLRCALLYAVRRGNGPATVPADLLRVLCEYGALTAETADDTRDLLFYLLTHRSDAAAEPLLAWVTERCAAAVAVLRRDNVLLCRFCALGDAIGVRWCVEKQLCDVHATAVNPLVACAAAGDAAAAAFLIKCAGADVNAMAGHESALAVALREGHEEVAQVLILNQAALSSRDGSWTALQQATSSNLESVVRGLLGSCAIDPFHVSRVLLRTLQGLVYERPSRRRERSRLASYLARACDPLAFEVHPTELLHLSAAVGCFDVTLALAERLQALPKTVWAELLATAPPPPPRPTTLIAPTLVPLTIKAPRLLPNRLTGRGGLYCPPKPFYRLVVPTVRRATVVTLLHRVKVRDVYSYAVEAGQIDLVRSLRYSLHLPPWPLRDVRGWTVTDYAMAHHSRSRASLVALFIAAGIAPATRHGRRMLHSSGDDALVAAVHYAQQQRWKTAAALQCVAKTASDAGAEERHAGEQAAMAALELVADTLFCLVNASAEKRVSDGGTATVRCVLDAFLETRHLSDFHHVPCAWLGRVVVACAAAGRLDVLRLLKEHYSVDLAQDWCNGASLSPLSASGTQPTPLLMAVHQRHSDIVTYLLKAGCAVHERSCPTAAMTAHVPLGNIHASLISPLCLAAWKRDYVLLRLLLAGSPPLRAEDTEEEVGRSVGDVLRGLVMSAPPGMQREAEAALADCVRALATAGHPLRFAGTVRVAAAKGLVQVAQALVECYGSAALLADLAVSLDGRDAEAEEDAEDAAAPRVRGQLTALAYFAADARLVPALRALLVERMVDEYQLESWRPTTLAATVQALCRKAGRRGARVTAAAVDYALWRGCADGAVVLLALGLVGRGVAPAPRPPCGAGSAVTRVSARALSLCLHLFSVLRLWHKRCGQYKSYTVLHSAAELGYGDVVSALTAEMMGLHLPVVGSDGNGSVLSYSNTRATVTAPSLYALAATHADGWRWFPYFERVELVLDPRTLYIAARDMFALIFSDFGVSQTVDRVCRRAAQHKLLGDVFSVFDSAGTPAAASASLGDMRNPGALKSVADIGGAPAATRGCAVSASFVSRQLQLRPAAFFLAGGTYVLTSLTSLTCAIAAGSLEWVQYIAVQGPSLVYHRATATRLSTAADRRATTKERHAQLQATMVAGNRPRPWHLRQGSTRRPHRCEARLDDRRSASAASAHIADGVCSMGALTLCMAMLAEAHLRRQGSAMAQTYEDILTHLLSWPGATPRKETINLLAIVAASLRRWPLLMLIMQQADRLYAAGLLTGMDDAQEQQCPSALPRYLFPLLPEELPAVLAHVIGSARHVMHAVARWAPKDVLIEVTRHCQRSDVEAAADARGCTSVYHALHHRQPFALETFAALRVPMGQPCRKRQCQTPLMVAAARGCTAFVVALLKPHRVNQRDREGRTALMLAAAHGHRATVEALLAANADVSLGDSCGRTAVMLAALGGYDDLAVQLVQNFCHAGDLMSAQTSVLHCAAVGGCWRTTAAALKLAVPPGAQLMGGCAEAFALLALREDMDGHTPLHLAHAFGSARVLHELLQVLFNFCEEGGTVQGLLARLSTHGGGSIEKRLLLCDSTLQQYGWLRGVLEVNAALQEKVRQGYEQSPAARGLKAGEVVFQPFAPPLRSAASLLLWCVQTSNTVGLRVLADYNVADDCGVLHVAAANGSLNVVKLLVQLEMSDPSMQDARTGRYAFEWAALHENAECASFLLTHTALDCAALLDSCMSENDNGAMGTEEVPPETNGGWTGEDASGNAPRAGDSSSAASSAVPLLHVMAGHCGGQLLLQFVEQILYTAARTYMVPSTRHGGASGEQSGAEVMSLVLYRALQRPAGPSRLTPLEYAIAVGDPAAVLHTAQVLQRLQETADALKPALSSSVRFAPMGSGRSNTAGAVRWDGEEGVASLQPSDHASTTRNGAVFVSKSFLSWVPILSPAVRAILFDVLGMWEVASVAGFAPQRHVAQTSLTTPPTDGGADANCERKLQQSLSLQQRGEDEAAAAATTKGTVSALAGTQRVRFSDVRLLGIHMLQQDDYCAELLHDFLTPDHEREVLRLLLQDFPYKIRYEPDSYRQCSLSTQTQLLRWLGTSLVLGTYDVPPPSSVPTTSWAAATGAEREKVATVDSIEIQVVPHRGEEFVELNGTALSHSLYLSTAQHALAIPDVMARLPRTLCTQREVWRAELAAVSARATRLLQRQAHPVLQRSTVTVDWNLSMMSSDGTTSVSADLDGYGAVFVRVCEALRTFMDWVRGQLRSLLAEVDAADLAAVVVGVRQGGMAGLQVRFRYVTEEHAVTRFPAAPTAAASTALMFKSAAYPSCCIEFNEVTHTDVMHVCQATIGRAIAADVALVRVHHTRDRFLQVVHQLLSAPKGVAVVSTTPPRHVDVSKENGRSAAADVSPSPPRDAEELKKSRRTKSACGLATPPLSSELLRFKLELEGTTLDAMPVQEFERLLLAETAAAIDAVVSPWPRAASPSRKSTADAPTKAYDAFHSAAILSAALVRRLRSVLVLFTTRREAMVRLSSDKLMLCFTADETPSRSDIAAEITRTLVQEECDVYQRRLAEVYEMMTQRLTAYLPQAKLVVDVEAMQRLAGDDAHMLSAMRLLVHQQSEWVLQRLVEGVSIGWDTELGAVVRRHVLQVTLTLDPGLYGTCYLSPDGVFAYYCPLLCLERQPPGALTPSSLPSWQLLSSQHIASLLLMQLAVREPQVLQFVDRKRSVACWTTARRIPRRILPGRPVVIEVQARNLFNRPLRRGGERLLLMGEVEKLRVEDAGKGRYMIRFDSPQRAGGHRLFILLHGQPIAQSPMWYTVWPGVVDLCRTRVCDTFNAVVIGVPFTVLLQLRDAAGNRLLAAPNGLTVACASPASMVQLQTWGWKGPGRVAVTLRVLPAVPTKTALIISLKLTCQSAAAGATADGAVCTATVPLPAYSCVDSKTYQHVCRVRRGLIADSGSPIRHQSPCAYPGMGPTPHTAPPQPSSLYFRQATRRAVRRKLAKAAAALGGALSYRYPRNAAMKRLQMRTKLAALKGSGGTRPRAKPVSNSGSAAVTPTTA
ncbi:putative ankyrin repeat protein [Leishmania major strain Friedlin]|uniref:Putative ankyrin repeat protein n=1 Tax=Leishmania major TaxID=5664 RepID=E9AF26_LEIMA|nr:putative ankyrin repeat protein [Leishmania major strain Friedlin]CAG9582555.1 ankyrin_repeat_protein_-_putative [Leishmania major strain Friedlin]CBZ12830.1 putative ankyrin repeat protein [Leishmania major strain Friedlin]|eukprot:XP_003722596.1 putative ankyrin repeat protein [Leishmania major strain Friedlin]